MGILGTGEYLIGIGGGDTREYSGISPISVDNTAKTISIDMSNYYTKAEVSGLVSGFTTQSWVSAYVQQQGYLDESSLSSYLSNYYTKTQTDNLLQSYATLEYIQSLSFATQSWVSAYVQQQGYTTSAYISANYYGKTATDSMLSAKIDTSALSGIGNIEVSGTTISTTSSMTANGFGVSNVAGGQIKLGYGSGSDFLYSSAPIMTITPTSLKVYSGDTQWLDLNQGALNLYPQGASASKASYAAGGATIYDNSGSEQLVQVWQDRIILKADNTTYSIKDGKSALDTCLTSVETDGVTIVGDGTSSSPLSAEQMVTPFKSTKASGTTPLTIPSKCTICGTMNIKIVPTSNVATGTVCLMDGSSVLATDVAYFSNLSGGTTYTQSLGVAISNVSNSTMSLYVGTSGDISATDTSIYVFGVKCQDM